ncbi:hypothetical protein B296_00038116 [Ensete ventricosum]|uniref:Uncharacterized protein n=1 Tax=Ensete ventricosum TaxID=4639 RepID=A0A426ZT84_ENSVE|nr:hypothetical protein B296_00038116 [Ensete ventricosum]
MYHLRNSKYSPFPMYLPMGSRTSSVSQKKVILINFAQSRVSIDFLCTVSEIQIKTIPNVLALRKLYELSFTKKHDGYKLCTKSRVNSSFDRFFMLRLINQNTGHSQRISPWEVI